MADLSAEDASLRASNLKLLETGNFADAELICGGKTFKIHKAVVCTRSVWFEKALTGGFAEASTGKITINEEEPEAIEAILKYIYGGVAAVDIVTEDTRGTNEPIFTACVELFRAAQFLLLHPLLLDIQSRLGKECDWKLKQVCTSIKVILTANDKLWISDLAMAIKLAYKAGLEVIKKIFVEFVWAGRWAFLGGGVRDISFFLDDTPEFFRDLLQNCAAKRWLLNPIWAPKSAEKALFGETEVACGRCRVRLVNIRTAEAEGQVYDPFTLGEGGLIRRKWCSKCSKSMKIPWRDASY